MANKDFNITDKLLGTRKENVNAVIIICQFN
jgi:hypothetical protein